MPHIVIEYCAELEQQVNINDLLEAAHNGAFASGLFPEYDIKSRATGYQFHRTGQTRDSFVHINLHLLSGRSDEQKADLSEKLLAAVEPLLTEVVSVGVEIFDMHRDSYRKRVLGG